MFPHCMKQTELLICHDIIGCIHHRTKHKESKNENDRVVLPAMIPLLVSVHMTPFLVN